MLRFDTTTLTSWKNEGIQHISCIFENGGCEGTTLKIIPGIMEGDASLEIQGSTIRCSTSAIHLHTLENAFITQSQGKWIISSGEILTHCGCGKSFQEKTGDPKIDKIRLLRAKLNKKNHAHHA